MQIPFTEALYVGRPNLGNREILFERIARMLDIRWLSNNGPMVIQFEEALAEYTGVKHCIAMCNATIAMELVARALDISGEVIVPAYTFVATAHAFRWLGINPVFAEMDATSHNIDPSRIEELITPRTKAIVGTHVWGRPCAVEAIQEIADRHNLKVIYDAAHAFGCSYKGRMIGAFGNCEVFSFHATKFINCFEGGAIATNDDSLAEKLRLMRNFGFRGFDNVIHLGTNGKLSEIHAAMGLTSLEAIDEIIGINKRNYEAYKNGLSAMAGVKLIEFDAQEKVNFQYIVVEVDPNYSKTSRDEIVERLIKNNVIARKYFWPGVHRMEPYRSEQPSVKFRLPVAEELAARIMVLPTGQTVSMEMIDRICELIRNSASL